MSTWTKQKIGSLADIIMGQSPESKYYNEDGEGLPFFQGVKDFGEKYPTATKWTTYANKVANENDILFSVRAPVGDINVARYKCALGRGVCAIRSKKGQNNFLYFLLHGNIARITNIGNGAIYDSINKPTLENIELSVPDLPTQTRIAEVLSAYDDLIENNEKRIKVLEEMAELLYTEWFVRFKFPGHEAVKLVDSGTSFGKIPEGWEAKRLGDILTLSYGKALREEVRADGNVPVYGSSGIVGHHNKKLVDGPGIVVGRKGNVGSVFWVYEDFYPIDTTFFVKSELPLVYLYYLLKQQDFVTSDAAVPGLNREYAYSKLVLVPAVHLVDEFAIQISPLRDLSFRMQKENEKLVSMRDLLIPQLVTGKRELR